MKLFLPLLALVSLCSFASAKEGWTENFEQAKARAQAEHKKMLLDFTGSDWCGWCIKLDREVFSKKEFQDYAAKNLVLVELDFPRAKKQSGPVKQQNAALAKKYSIQGYPTIIVLGPDGKKRGELGYVEGGPRAFIRELEKVR
jgi:protein disulfide-isomerase